MVYAVISCIAELTLSLSNTTLEMSLYRRKGALAPGPPLPQEKKAGLAKEREEYRGMAWSIMTSRSVLEAGSIY